MSNQSENGHLPVYGVGPFYGRGVILLIIAGIVISVTGPLDSGLVHNTILVVVFIIVGVLVAIGGFIVWKWAALKVVISLAVPKDAEYAGNLQIRGLSENDPPLL